MVRSTIYRTALIAAVFASAAPPLAAQLLAPPKETETIRQADAVLDEIMSLPNDGIPRAMLNDARGVAIIPNVVKGSFVVGARHGKGVLLLRNERGEWAAPVFISLTGGSVGWQIGLQATDVILVFKTQKSIEGILSGKFTLGADASVAAGPVGRQAAAATDGRLQAEIYSYSRSRGLFAGVALDGSVLQIDEAAGTAHYTAPGGGTAVPAETSQLVQKVAAYSAGGEPLTEAGVAPTPIASPAPLGGGDPLAAAKADLARQSLELYRLLDPTWQRYLALPAEVFEGTAAPPLEGLQRAQAAFDQIGGNPQYRDLASRPEFQNTAALLRRYTALLTQSSSTLQLPPPPASR